MRRRFYVSFLAMAFILVFLPCLVHAQAAKTVKIGALSPHTGPVAYFGLSVFRSVELAAKNINEKGPLKTPGPGGIQVGGERYKLEVVSYDDGGNPANSVSGMRKLVEMHKVPVIFGPFGTPATMACQEVNVGLNVLFSGLSASDQVRRKGNPLYFQERMPALYWGEPMGEAAYQKGFRKACVISDINEAYVSWAKKFQSKFESLGGKVLAFETVDTKATTDYHSVMTSFKAKGADIIFLSFYEEPAALAASHALDVGYKGKFMLNSDWGKKSEKIVGLDRLQGSLVESSHWMYYQAYPDRDKEGYLTRYLKQYKEIYGDIPAQPGSHIYGMIYTVARAMELANNVTDPKAIRAAAPQALREGKLPLIYPNTDILHNGLVYGAPDYLLEIKGNGYTFIRELQVPKNVLE
jgi:branched-chain amino acid transport system substrate-binding protein